MGETPPKRTTVRISGAGPAGLAAAITAARAGARAVLFERHTEVGHRFHGDLQGIENWTTDRDVLEDLASLGVEPTFDHAPFHEAVLFDADGREYRLRDDRALFYVVRRGPAPDSLDRGLERQARSLGVEVRLGTRCRHLPGGGVVAEGPHRADAIAVGYVFATGAADGAYGVLSDRLSAHAYAYLVVHSGRGVLATCLFDDFHHEQDYLDRTEDFFRSRVGLDMREPRRFGGTGNFTVPETARKRDILYAGESAGFQDAFAGFGMRLAMVSGHLAARALLEGRPGEYDAMWRRRIGGQIRASIVNRFLYERLGDRAGRSLARYLSRRGGVRAPLRRAYTPAWWKTALYPLARVAVERQFEGGCLEPDCDCTWCRCRRVAA